MTRKRAPWEVDGPADLVALPAWGQEHAGDRLAVIEDDVRQLVRQLASARSELAEQGSAHARELEGLLLSLLDVLDGFERVFANIRNREAEITPTMKAWIGNFRTVERILERVLQERGVTTIATPTREFDPRWHTAAETVIDGSLPAGAIVEEIKRGYVWRKQVLRKADVVVVREDPDPVGQPPPGNDRNRG